MNYTDLLIERLEKIDIVLNEKQIGQFLQYYDMLIEKNRVMNLTAITEYEDVVNKHFVDSLSLVRIYDFNRNISVIDVGTGAGFPGIPLKIVFPNLQIVLLDSLNKRINFLNEVILALKLENITAIHGRAEECGRDKNYREKFDLCVSRAVANLASLSEYCMPFVKKGGLFIPYKSGKISEELESSQKAVHVLGGEIEQSESFLLPGTDIERALPVIKKVKITPLIYPRGAGKPTREPIG